MIARYEELRCLALGPAAAQPQGLALFMHRGMGAWMQAWRQGVAPVHALAQPPSQTQEICPVHLHRDVAMLLASMVLFARQEAIR